MATQLVDQVVRTWENLRVGHESLRVLPAVLRVFFAYSAFDCSNRARLKFLVARIGIERFVDLCTEPYTAARNRGWFAGGAVGRRSRTVDRGAAR